MKLEKKSTAAYKLDLPATVLLFLQINLFPNVATGKGFQRLQTKNE